MNWNGFQEVAMLASRWKLPKACVRELTALMHLEYNAGANDHWEYLQQKEAKEDKPSLVMLIHKKTAIVAR